MVACPAVYQSERAVRNQTNPDIFDILRELVMQYVLIKEYR